MFKAIVGDRNLEHWKDYVSPAFFDLLSASEVARQVAELASSYWQRQLYSTRAGALGSLLSTAGVQLRLSTAVPSSTLHTEEHGALVVELFFFQLLSQGGAFLDLDRSRFGLDEHGALWSPGMLWVTWDVEFLQSLRDMYCGFYGEDDARFRRGLASLGLLPAAAVFEEQFGGSRRGALRFSVEDFRNGFHDTFVCCRDAHTRLHRNFLALGIYLGSLYEHLETLGVAVDVAGAFGRARSRLQEAGLIAG
jgi:hypothetical protein